MIINSVADFFFWWGGAYKIFTSSNFERHFDNLGDLSVRPCIVNPEMMPLH